MSITPAVSSVITSLGVVQRTGGSGSSGQLPDKPVQPPRKLTAIGMVAVALAFIVGSLATCAAIMVPVLHERAGIISVKTVGEVSDFDQVCASRRCGTYEWVTTVYTPHEYGTLELKFKPEVGQKISFYRVTDEDEKGKFFFEESDPLKQSTFTILWVTAVLASLMAGSILAAMAASFLRRPKA